MSKIQTSISHRKDKKMWRDRILEAQKEKGVSIRFIAEYTQLSEKTVRRMLTDPENVPYVDNVIVVGASVGLSPRDLFSETGLVVGDQGLSELQAEVDKLKAERDALVAENAVLKDKVESLKDKVDSLKDDLIAALKQKVNK